MRFSANLGFLFTELALPEAIEAAAAAGFDAVECHFPYDVAAGQVSRALLRAGLPMLSLNTMPGPMPGKIAAGDSGLAALPGRETDARAAIDQAVDYAAAVGAGAVHVMAGRTDGGHLARRTFESNLRYACSRARESAISIFIEPINPRDVPGYHLATLDAAVDTIDRVGDDCLRIMFDFYHVQIIRGDLVRTFETHRDLVGHVQMAGVPDRGPPDRGEVNYVEVLRAIKEMGYDGAVGAEYRPRGATVDDLAWLAAFRAALA